MRRTEKYFHILEKAEDLFAERGFDGATVRDIADSAGVNLAMISYYFGSKEKLMESLFKERMILMKLKVEALIENKTITPVQRIEILIDNYIEKVIDKQPFYKIMLCEQVINKNTIVLKLIKELKLSYARMLSVLISEGQKQKIFKKNIDIMLLTNTMSGTATQLIINKEYYKEFNNYTKIPETEFDNILMTKLRAHLKFVFKAILGYE
ncbi:MAG: TetR/AcrR family transcriptional regulator [Bacteroidetes bacterium]|nr:TetR/AcrR family transcriptional regulator [Bacteroidota bacterium]MBS1757545.1 TetR/AcrR family transcriptional regulator [Bacteroidota bacterium]